jgi:hypothetical protein
MIDAPEYDDQEPTGPSLPHDLSAEAALLGAVFVARDPRRALRDIHLDINDLYRPAHQLIYGAIGALVGSGEPINPITVTARLQQHGQLTRAGGPAYIHGLVAGSVGATAGWLADRIRSLALRRPLIHAGSEIAAMGYSPEGDPADLAEHAVALTRDVRDAGRAAEDSPVMDIHDFLAIESVHDWVLPGYLERGDRVIWTAHEGGGKSVMLRQIATAAACGAQPFGFDRNAHGPQKTLVLDCENSASQSRRQYRKLIDIAEARNTPVKPGYLHIDVRPEGVDLTRADGRAWLMRRVEEVQPDLLVIGPIYQLSFGDPNSEEHARKVTTALNEARLTGRGCAMVLEAHAPHSSGYGPRALRPAGSSVWMRWPEFGLGIRPVEDETSDQVYRCRRVIPWRGARDERAWPAFIKQGKDTWPWAPYMPIDADHNGYSPTGANG